MEAARSFQRLVSLWNPTWCHNTKYKL